MNKTQREEVVIYLIKKLESFGCPNSYLERTAKSMVNTIQQIMEKYKDENSYWYGKRVK